MSDPVGNKILITGAAGFIGRWAAAYYQKLGWEVFGMDLVPASAMQDDGLPGESSFSDWIQKDITSRELGEVFPQVDAVLHTAAIVTEGGDWDLFRKVNVEAPQRLARLAREKGASQFIHLSSVMVYGFQFPDGIDERGPLDGADNPYCQTKIESEDAVLQEMEQGFDVFIIRPGDVYGPGSQPWIVRPLELMRKNMFALPDGGRGRINHVYIDNLLDGIEAVRKGGRPGQSYNVSDGVATPCSDYFGILAEIGKLDDPVKVPSLLTPVFGLVLGAVNLADSLGLLKVNISSDGIPFLQRNGCYSIDKVQKETGYYPSIGLTEGMNRVASWLNNYHGLK
jgi:nucleoside-diphosphate-sugar epimerase